MMPRTIFELVDAIAAQRERESLDFELVCRPLIRDGRRAHRRMVDLIQLGSVRTAMPPRPLGVDVSTGRVAALGSVPGAVIGVREGHDWRSVRREV